MSRPALEVADIFRDHGAAWRRANAGHVSLDQLKVMSAIERCRTAALGGHVARCENETCAHTVIAYNSCRNRHCPKCQGAAAREWLAEREAELLPVPYFHVVYTLPAPIADIAYQNKARDLRSAVQGGGRDHAHDRGRSQASRRPHRHHCGAAHLGLGADASSARPHDRAGRRPVAGRHDDGSRAGRDFSCPCGCSRALFRRLFLADARRGARTPADCSSSATMRGSPTRLHSAAYLAPLRKIEWVVYAKEPFGGPEAGAALSVALHPPRRDLQSPADRRPTRTASPSSTRITGSRGPAATRR